MGGDNVASARRSSRQISSLGSTISSEELQVAVEIRQSAGLRLVSDETYGLMTEGEPLPPAACADPTAVSLSTMSKTFGLPGIRIGWIATRDADLMHRLLAAREHITITNNVLGEYIALQVQRDSELFLARARARVAKNRAIVADVIENNPRLDWIPPTTGVVQDHPTANIGLGTRVSFHVVDLGGEAAPACWNKRDLEGNRCKDLLCEPARAWMEQGLREAAGWACGRRWPVEARPCPRLPSFTSSRAHPARAGRLQGCWPR